MSVRGAFSQFYSQLMPSTGQTPSGMDQKLQEQFSSQQAVYDLLWEHFDGTHWDRLGDDNKTLKWPLKINFSQAASFIHTSVWAGDMPDTSDPVVKPHLEPKKPGKQAATAAAHATEIVNRVWYENHGRSLLMGANTVAQATGGVVLRLRRDNYKGWRRTLPIRIEAILPDYFIGVADGSDFYDLLEVWIARELPLHQVELEYGYKRTKRDSDTVQVVEHWTRQTFRITVNGKVPTFRNQLMEGANPRGFVPFVYFPHIRHAGIFTGIPLFAQLMGLAEELNQRRADEGDYILKIVHEIPWMRNVRSKAILKKVGKEKVLDLGTASATSGDPEIGYAKRQGSPVEGAKSYNAWLETALKELIFTPEVAWGQDSGSQRSGESRDRLLLPLTMHINMERENWAPGLSLLDEMILRMVGAAGLEKINQRHYNHRISQQWHPLYPADRAKLVKEMQLRAQAHLVSPEHAIEKLGDVEDIETELQRIKDFAEFKSNLRPAPSSNAETPSKEVDND